MDLSKRVFGSDIDSKVKTYLQKLQEGTFNIKPGDPIGVSYDTKTYLGDRTPYARMWVAVNVVETQIDPEDNTKFETVGDGQTIVHILNDNRFGSYIKDELDSVGELDNNPYLKPSAGITEVTSNAMGSIGALRQTTVKFIVHNKADFDQIFLPFFLRPGSTVFVDFGWTDKNLALYNPNDFIDSNDISMNKFYDEIYNNDDVIKGGFQTTVSGQVTKYDVNVDNNGSFECTLDFVSKNTHLLETEVSEDNNLKFIFTNVLEDLLLLKYLNTTDAGAEIVKEELSESYLWKEITREERSKQIKKFLDRKDSFDTQKVIDDYSKKVGVFYQNIHGQDSKTKDLQQMESLYVSFAVFEDDFLNNYVAYWTNKDGVMVTPDKTANLPKFSSRNTYVRWNENLYNMMKIKPRSIDKPLSFLYPDSWNSGETSNIHKPSKDIYVNETTGENNWPGNGNITEYDIKKQRIPLRELFIRTSVIIEAFNTSTNVNDALEKIFDHIFEDSGNLINIRLMKNNDFESSLTFHDVNIETIEKKPLETFIFDVTSGNTVVQSVDLKFETPKAGLSSMIAIGGLSEPQLFDEFQLMRFNLLNMIQTNTSEKKVQIRHLPVFGDIPKDNLNYDVDVSKVIGTYSSKNPNIKRGLLPAGFDRSNKDKYKEYKTAREEYFESNKKKKPNEPKSEKLEKTTLRNDKRYVLTASSERDIELLKAKMYTLGASGENTIAPVLPINLTLDVYGNNFLNIGDYFTINYLPDHFEGRVYFQVVGVNHNVSTSNWKTTYNTVMRPYSTKKYYQYSVDKSLDLSKLAKITINGVLMEELMEQLIKESGVVNQSQSYMTERFEVLNQGQLRRPTTEENIFFKTYLVHYDVYKTDKKGDGHRGLFISTSGKKPLVKTEGQLVWLMAVSNQIFKAIDWIKWDKDQEKTIHSFGAQKSIILNDTGTESNEEGGSEGNVYVAHQKEGIDSKYKKLLFDRFVDNVATNALAHFNPDSVDKYKGDVIEGINKFVENQAFLQDSVYSSVFPTDEIPQRSRKGSGFMFLTKIDFALKSIPYDENNLDNQFKILKFEDNQDCENFSIIQLPSKYLIEGLTMEDLAKEIWKEYNTFKASLLEITGELIQDVKYKMSRASATYMTAQQQGGPGGGPQE